MSDDPAAFNRRLREASHPRAVARVFQDAIDRRAEEGGGTVVVPPGVWRTTTVTLHSGIELHLERGAVLCAHEDLDDYPQRDPGHNKDRQPYRLLEAHEAHDLALTGQGTIDGNGFAFWDPPLDELRAAGQDDAVAAVLERRPCQVAYPQWWIERSRRISPLIEFSNCHGVSVRDVHIVDSPGWTLHCHVCDQVRIEAVTVRNHLFGPNTDGFDLNGCHDVVVRGCDLTCGDDAIIIKATRDARSSERILVTGCTLATNCAALGIGAETVHATRDIHFADNLVHRALRGLQIECWEAGLVEHVTLNGLTGATLPGIDLDRPLYVDIQHHRRTDGALGHVRHLRLSDINLRTGGRCLFTAADGALIEDVAFHGASLAWPHIEDPLDTVPRSTSTQMANDAPEARIARAAIVCANVERMSIADIVTRWPDSAAVPMHGLWCRRCQDIRLASPFLTASRPDVDRIVDDSEAVSDRLD